MDTDNLANSADFASPQAAVWLVFSMIRHIPWVYPREFAHAKLPDCFTGAILRLTGR
jgi:hypothetical protein